MKVSRENCPVKPLIGKMKREKIVLKHKLQRRESVWSNPNKSLLIDSLLRGYIVPPVYTISEDGVQYVIDGVQRLSTLKGFYNDEFAISKKAEPVIIEGTEYSIAGLKFSKLDQVVKDELDSSAITVYEITEYTDKDVREMFRRLNSGKPLNTRFPLQVFIIFLFSSLAAISLLHTNESSHKNLICKERNTSDGLDD